MNTCWREADEWILVHENNRKKTCKSMSNNKNVFKTACLYREHLRQRKSEGVKIIKN